MYAKSFILSMDYLTTILAVVAFLLVPLAWIVAPFKSNNPNSKFHNPKYGLKIRTIIRVVSLVLCAICYILIRYAE